jgi:RHS repeat-associated protein
MARNGATLSWASYDLPTSLASGGNTASFAYTPERARWRQIAVTAGVTETTIYVSGIVEKVTKPTITLWKHYVATPTGMGAVYVRRSDGTSDTYYLTTDQLGSTDRILKAATGTVQVAESFDAFGKRRGSDWQGAPSAADLTAISNSTPDGFTGHEMLDGVGLIHMNGRVYDPTVGRFLSVDPIVRDAAASQSWNGYGYVEGRLLSATDPTGWVIENVTVKARRIQFRADPPPAPPVDIRVPQAPERMLEEVVVTASGTSESGQPESQLKCLSNGSISLVWPVPGHVELNEPDRPGEGGPRFGDPRRRRPHAGIDIKAPFGANVVAVADGSVARADGRDATGYGNQVIVRHRGDLFSVYGHLDSMRVSLDEGVRAGDSIGTVGLSGNTPGDPHLHFEIRNGSSIPPSQGGAVIDPFKVLNSCAAPSKP